MTLVGTFITRSGIITSVHAFSESDLGYWFLGYITVYLLFAFGFLGFNWDSLKDNSNLKESASKENAILFNNLLFLGMFVAVFFGTTWPIFSEISFILEGWLSDKRAGNNLKASGSIDLTEFFNPKFALNLFGEDISISSSYD